MRAHTQVAAHLFAPSIACTSVAAVSRAAVLNTEQVCVGFVVTAVMFSTAKTKQLPAVQAHRVLFRPRLTTELVTVGPISTLCVCSACGCLIENSNSFLGRCLLGKSSFLGSCLLLSEVPGGVGTWGVRAR